MPNRTKAQDLLTPVDDASGAALPPHFAEALDQVRTAIKRCNEKGITSDTVVAALMTELMPRLVEAHGPSGVASMLNRLAHEIASADSHQASFQ